MIPNDGLSETFYKMRNDDALLAKATRNLANQLDYFQNVGASTHLSCSGNHIYSTRDAKHI